MAGTPPPPLSPDGRWFWDGADWRAMPAVSRWSLPRCAWMAGGGWLLLLGAWVPALLVVGPPRHHPDRASLAVPVSLAILAVVSTVGCGLALALLRRWTWILVAAPVGTGVLLTWYVVAMLASPDPNADIEAGAGLVIIAVPTLALVTLLLMVGGGIGAWRARRARSA